jgi:hypothetical protein
MVTVGLPAQTEDHHRQPQSLDPGYRDLCMIDPPRSNDSLGVPDHNSRPPAMDRVSLHYVIFPDLVQNIQVAQFHKAEICWTINGW